MTMIPEMDQQAYLDRMLGALRNTEDKSPNSFSYDNLSAVAFLAEDISRGETSRRGYIRSQV